MNEFAMTFIGNKEDEPYLRSRLLDVNVRLLKESKRYRNLVEEAYNLIGEAALKEIDGYSLPYGMSAANLGIPWNIIAIVRKRGTDRAYSDVLINPVITRASPEIQEVLSNCGSVRLEEPIKGYRRKLVTIDYVTLGGEPKTVTLSREQGGFTAQHEIDHNRGKLITDYIQVSS